MELATKVSTWDRDLLLYSTEHPDFENTLHCPERCKIFFVIKGSGAVIKDKIVEPFGANSLLFFTHDSTAKLQIEDPDSFECCGLYFAPIVINDDLTFDWIQNNAESTDYASTVFHDMLLLDFMYGFRNQQPVSVLTPSKANFMALLNLFNLLHEQLVYPKDDFFPCRSRSYLIEILFSLQSLNAIFESQGLPDTLPKFYQTENNTINKILTYVNCHIADKITLTELGHIFAFNRNQINEIFHTEFQCTFTQYLINLRMDFACSLLRNTYLKQKDIALRCGFSDYGHFCKTFKKKYKLTPQDYRNTCEHYQYKYNHTKQD